MKHKFKIGDTVIIRSKGRTKGWNSLMMLYADGQIGKISYISRDKKSKQPYVVTTGYDKLQEDRMAKNAKGWWYSEDNLEYPSHLPDDMFEL